MRRPTAIRLASEDNVAVACRQLQRGESLESVQPGLTTCASVPPGHKVSLEKIPAGDPVRKYGQVIGFASADIPPGAHVHVHNVSATQFERDYAFGSACPSPPARPERERTFLGYERPDGRVGTRNYIAVISTVNCSASTSKYITGGFPREILKSYPNVDGLLAIVHKGGCAMQYEGPDHQQLNRVLSGMARHPNVGAYLLVGLGCETGQAVNLLRQMGVNGRQLVQIDGIAPAPSPASEPPVINIQEAGGIRRTVEAGIRALNDLLPRANDVQRLPFPASKLVLGTQCGGSDGNSGITANPAVGVASDYLVAHGGTTVLGETTEIYGAEHLLTRRAINRAVGEALVERLKWWEWYTSVFGAEINNNPSPGNKEGGLTTIYEKSLGAIAKAGSTALRAVYPYAAEITDRGFVVMDTPGYDPVSLTGIVAGGANICVFTTGRGSVYGCKPSPCIKIATNTPLYERMADDMDINAGVILEGASVSEVGERVFEEILAVASGKKTRSEEHGVGEEEFAPWTLGPVL